ncbi:hypothetical protein [Mucilaginibacter sp.]|jgi:hypothetical protein|uniref:hypothetical protein n=1 Tax=Mucilaginibacter sp. TaxID=1882438 RepID=UPI00263A02DB|nr:hypothetical protein [Mucilaginibacter sp.]MDB4926757.1 hypothetical protein [Mucilaginibacter sp.]
MKNESVGMGTSVPPTKNHVLIYFSQKGAPDSAAIDFYNFFNARKWQNQRRKKVSNWKFAAWIWIINIS